MRHERNLRGDKNVPYFYCVGGGYTNVFICQNSLNCTLKKAELGNSLAVQWLGLRAFTARTGSIPVGGTKIPQVMWRGQKKWGENLFM